MWLTSISIKRPLFILMVISGLLVIGLVSWSRMPVDLWPALDFPVVSVTTVYPGAGPEAIDTLVTRKVEDALAGMNDLDYVVSSSFEGVSSVTLVFTEKAGKDSAIDVERRVNAIRNQLPADIRPPTIGKFDPNAQPILSLAVSGNRDLGQLQRLAEDKIQKRLEATSGVGQVSLIGGLEREIQVQVDQRKLQARGLSILQLNQALAADNLNVPAGNITQRGKDWTVRLSNQAQTPAELNEVLVASTPSGPVYLRDVATVVDTYKKVGRVQRSNGQPALGITIVKQASANTIQTVDAARKVLKQLEQELPSDVQIGILTDASVFIRQSLNDVQTELTQAVLLTGLVLLVFLHTLRSTVIVLLAIPTSIIATLGVMYFLGFSLNMMSLMALTLTVGILVDDSIVVLENIFRHLQAGKEPKQAALSGRSEIGFAAIAITLVDIVVFTPIAFMTGIVGQYFRQFGLVIATATLFSLFVSFTLTPLLASRWYRKGQSGELEAAGRSWNPGVLFARAWNAGYRRLARDYGRLLKAALRFRWIVVGLGAASFGAGIALVTTGILSTEFMPNADSGELVVSIEMPAGTPLEVTDTATRTVEERILAWPEVDKVFTSVGVGGNAGGGSQTRFARLLVELKKKHERRRTPQQLVEEARTFGRDLPGAVIKSSIPSFVGPGGSTIAVRIQGEDQKVLASLASQVAGAVRKVPGTRDVSDGGVTGQPELVVSVDHERAADLGLTPGQVASVLRTGLAGSTVGTFRPEGTRGWDVTVVLSPDERARAEQIPEIPIVTPKGVTVRLGQVARVASVSGPTQIDRRDRQRSVYVTGEVSGRAVGDVSKEIQAGVDQVQVPAGYTVSQGGVAQAQNETFEQIFQALGLSVLLMYMLMVALFESLLYPLIVMLSLPLAVVGAFGLLALTGNTLSMMSMIGLILLTGLVGKNAILLVDYTNTLRARGLARDAALLEAGPTRLRPILMTTCALVLAMLPLALKLGEGSEWRGPMAITVIGGLITSTLLTLVLVPAVYTILDDFQHLVAALVARLGRRTEVTHQPSSGQALAPGQPPAPLEGPLQAPLPSPAAGGSE
ncbi:MAG: efflux RND transporter permease subunit [Chloroflexi bacterium]|nr:efflux RND transporter permease subunit [Chloroflexota bacterium]